MEDAALLGPVLALMVLSMFPLGALVALWHWYERKNWAQAQKVGKVLKVSCFVGFIYFMWWVKQ